MYNNHGKVNIIVILLIIIIQLLISGGVYFLFLKDRAAAGENQGLSAIDAARIDVQPAQPMRTPERPDPRAAQNPPERGSFMDSSQYDVAKDYEKDFALFKLDDIIINPAGTENQSRFFVVTITFEYRQADRRLPNELTNKTPVLKDRIIEYFSKMTVEEIRKLENRQSFKMDIMRMANNSLLHGRVTDVIFDQFIIQ